MKENLLQNVDNLYFCGDIHRDYKELVWTITKRYGIRNSAIGVLGDFGVGFDNTTNDLYKWSEKRLEDTNNVIFAIRGNHDDPIYFTDEEKYSYPRLRFLEDHKIYRICGRDIYTIGGANSTDITYRLGTNQALAAKGKDRRVWWEDEGVIQQYGDLPTKADIIISHCAPLSFSPVITRFPETPEWQYEKILEERKYLDYVLENVNAKYWMYGHYHDHFSGSFGNLLYRGLGIMEIYEAPVIEEENPQGDISDAKSDRD
jgi:DNA repair exonuclease SbcCD nuclease subunit